MNIALTFAVVSGAALMALPAAAQPAQSPAPASAQSSGGSCFLTRDMRNHTIGDDKTLYFDVGGRSVFRATMSNNCLAGSLSSDPIVLRDFGGNGRICKPIELDIGVRGSRCIVDSLTKLTPAEVAALPRKLKP